MSPETQALNLLADECRKRNCAFLINRETGELDTLGQAAVAAVLAAGQAEREAVEERLCLSLWNHLRALGKNQYVCINLINKIVTEVLPDPPADHLPQRGEAEDDG